MYTFNIKQIHQSAFSSSGPYTVANTCTCTWLQNIYTNNYVLTTTNNYVLTSDT